MNSVTDADGLCGAALELGVPCSLPVAEALFRYLELLYFWNASAGLTTIPRAAAPVLHLLDSLAVGPLLGEARDVLDVGTGAGLPGIPLAVAYPDVAFTLVDSNRRKCSFLAEVVRSLALANVAVVNAKVDEIAAAGRTFEVVVSRAFRAPSVFLEIGARLVSPTGRIIVMTAGAEPDPSEEPVPGEPFSRILEERRLQLPGGARRRLTLRAAR